MGLKANIRPELDEAMGSLLKVVGAKSKTDFVNKAVEIYTKRLEREEIVAELNRYFSNPKIVKESRKINAEFAAIRRIPD